MHAGKYNEQKNKGVDEEKREKDSSATATA